MTAATAHSKPLEIAWEEAVSARRAASASSREEERASAEQVMRHFAMQDPQEPDSRAWAAALRKPVEAALDDLRHDPQRAASLLAPVMEDAFMLSRQRHQARRMEMVGKWCLGLTRPRMWWWALQALWEGDSVWHYIQDRAQWHEVPEIVLFELRTNAVISRVESRSHRPRPGEPRLESMSSPALQVAAEAEPEAEEFKLTPARSEDEVPMVSRIVVLVGWRCKLVARVRGIAPLNLRSRLQLLCEEAESLLDYSPPRAMIDRLLDRGLVCQVESSLPRSWVLAIGGLAAGCLVYWIGLREYRWHELITTLDREPGVKVLEQDTSWGRREISGLRDPLARKPEDIARALGVAPDQVVMSFKSYLSAEEPFVSHRAQARQASEVVPVIFHAPPATLNSSKK
ncbi:MAG: OmpA/MotB [Rhizorhabdus sp.]|nr:OmpA/MotB [Rhizorhabdus sp.]